MIWVDRSCPTVTLTRAPHPQPRRNDRARHEGLPARSSRSDPRRHARRRVIPNRCVRSLVAALTIWMALCGASWASQADLVVVGPIVTMAPSRLHAQGLAVAGGKIAFVGDAASARKRLRSGGRLIALERGQAVIPGLVDAHVHMLGAGVMRQRCTLDEAKTKARALEIIAAYSKEHPGLGWVIGSGWALSLFDD